MVKGGGRAVVLNDMIRGNLDREGDPDHNELIRRSGIVSSAQQLVAAARRSSAPIVWIRVERRADRTDVPETRTDRPMGWHLPTVVTRGSWMAEQIAELPVEDQDHVVLKPRLDPFQATDLDLRLRTLGARTLYLGGYSTNMGVESCARTAHDLGYNVVVVRDCCHNVATDLHQISMDRILPYFARVISLGDALAELA